MIFKDVIDITDIFILLVFGIFIAIGIKKGLVVTLYNSAAVILSLILSSFIYPYISKVFIGNDSFFNLIQSKVNQYLGLGSYATAKGSISENNKFIEGLPLPNAIIDAIKENNNDVMRSFLKSSGLEEYISKYVTTMIINVIAALTVFVIAFAIILLFRNILDTLTENIVLLNLLDSLCGGVLGFVQGLIFVWVLVVVITFFMPKSKFAASMETAVLRPIVVERNVILNMVVKIF